MGHKRKEGAHYPKKPILQRMRDEANLGDRSICVSAEAAEKALQIIEEKLTECILKALQVKNGLHEKSLCVSHFTLADDARRKQHEQPTALIIEKRKRGRRPKNANK